jgi:hypothetical protein
MKTPKKRITSHFEEMEHALSELIPFLNIPNGPTFNPENLKPACIKSEKELNLYQQAKKDFKQQVEEISLQRSVFNKLFDSLDKAIPEWDMWFKILIGKQTFFVAKSFRHGVLALFLGVDSEINKQSLYGFTDCEFPTPIEREKFGFRMLTRY